MITDEAMKLVDKIKEVIKEKYNGYEIKILGVHIEKIIDKNEYTITANFEVSRKTQDGIIVVEQKIVFLNNIITYTQPYKYIK